MINWMKNKFKSKKTGKRRYDAAKSGRLFADWITSDTSANTETFNGMVTLRDRARDLERNDPYIRKYLHLREVNIAGRGFKFTSRVRDFPTAADPMGPEDRVANDIIERNWFAWSEKQFASASGSLSMNDMERLWSRVIGRDGEIVVRMLRGFDNPWGFSLQFIDTALLDEQYNVTLDNGNQVIMGVEVDQWGRAQAYYFLDQQAASNPPAITSLHQQRLTRIPADEIIYSSFVDRAGSLRAVTPMASIMGNIKQLNGYREAELVAARTAACKMGFYTNPTGDEHVGDGNEDTVNFDGAWLQEAEPGVMEQLPTGWDIKTLDWSHPNSAYADFNKGILKGISTGLNVSYNMLANDPEGVNFSSLRGFVLADRDNWMMEQTKLIQDFLKPVFKEWLRMSMLTGAINLPMEKFNKFNRPHFQGPRWAWVDPLKDANANVVMRDNGWKTDSMIAGEQGTDFGENINVQQKDNQISEGVLPSKDGTVVVETVVKDDDDES